MEDKVNFKRLFLFLPAFIVSFGFVSSAHAQAVLTGTLSGTVQDSTGAVLPGVEIVLTDLEKGTTLNQLSDENGNFRFPSVPVGENYRLTAQLSGSRPTTITSIRILTSVAQKFSVTMQVGSVAEELTVTAEAPLVDVQTSITTETLMADAVKELPLYSRNKKEIAKLMAGVNFSRSESPGAGYGFHVRGDSTVAHGFRVDGATTIGAHGRTAASVAQNSVERFEFIPGGFQAEYGEQTGGMVNVITKSGTNEIHGSYDAMFRPERLASKVTGVQNQVKERQPGNTIFQEFAIGGPFVKNKVWYHFAMQYWRDERGSLLQPLVLHSDFTNFHTKFTYQQTEKDRWDLSVESDPFWQKNTVLTNDTAPEAQQYQDVSLYLVNLQHSHTFSKNTVLQSQAFLHHLGQTSGGMNVRNVGTMDDSNFRPVVTEVSAAGTYNSGYRNTRGQWADNRFRITEKLSTYQGKHNIKAGLDYLYLFGGRWSNIFGGAYNDRRPLGGTLTRTDTIQPDPTYDWTANDIA